MKIVFLFGFIFLLKIITGCEYRIFSSTFQVTNATGIVLDVSYQYKNGLTIHVNRSGSTIQSIYTSDDLSSSVESTLSGKNLVFTGLTKKEVTISLEVNTTDYIEFKVAREFDRGDVARDCLMLEKNVHWYGGPQMKYSQYWPIEKQNFTNEAYVTKEKESMAVTERYWLNSNGLFIYVEPETPLFITQTPNQTLCLIAKNAKPFNTDSRYFTFEYRIGIAKDPRVAHLKAVERFLKKPTGLPDETMVTYPIWSTWAKYKTEISATVVTEFAAAIKDKGFLNSQLEIDDKWEQCYGSLTINTTKFPDMPTLITELKADGKTRVTLWIHPFINVDCEPWYTEALNKGYFVKNSTGGVKTIWWNTPNADEYASYIDFTNTEAATWFYDRLVTLKEANGFDGFKFDAGETSWAPADPVLTGDNKKLFPGKLTTDYIKTVKEFGPITEVRSVQNNQAMDIFVRMIDKDTTWGYNNGLVTLVTTLLQMNMNGYPFVLPDMIGGNGYDGAVLTKELFIRWLQANVFMPALQYSYVPWDLEETGSTETTTLALKFNKLHADNKDKILAAMTNAKTYGYPVNAPIWWIAPTDAVALATYDEFLLGEDILVAPVLTQGATSRRVYLPAGTWKDGNSETKTYTGPTNFNYSAPLDTLPYFIKTA